MSGTSVTAVSLGLWQDSDPMEALATATAADECGYESLWIGEMATFDAFTLATAIGVRHPRLRLTVGPLAPAVRDPVGLAMGVASVQALTGQPVGLALGASSPTVVRRWHGRPYSRTARTLREALEVMRPLLDGEKVSHHGEVVSTDGYHLRLPAPRSTLTLAAFGPESVRTAGRLADRMVVNLCTPELVTRLRAGLEQAAAAASRPTPPLSIWVPAAVDPTEATIGQLTRALVAYLAAPGYGEMFASAGFADLVSYARSGAAPRDVLARVPAELPAAVGLVGDEATCRRRIAAYRDAGADDVVLVPATAGDPAGARTLAALSSASVPNPAGLVE